MVSGENQKKSRRIQAHWYYPGHRFFQQKRKESQALFRMVFGARKITPQARKNVRACGTLETPETPETLETSEKGAGAGAGARAAA